MALLLAACVGTAPGPKPGATPLPHPAALPDPAFARAADHYRKVESNLVAQGLLRTDGGGRDTPFGARALAQNFESIAFFDEFTDRSGRLVEGGGEQTLHRWQQPARVQLAFGASTPPDHRNDIRAEVSAYLSRLSHLTGLPISLGDTAPNVLILVLGPGERSASAPRIAAFAPGTSPAAIASVVTMRPDIYCTAFSNSSATSAVYDRAIIVIRSELPDLMTSACIHEEMAQALGLVNDSPAARPSIFNDNQEFALLTRQDEMMLRMLYDQRLDAGMTLQEARPLIETIAGELKPGES